MAEIDGATERLSRRGLIARIGAAGLGVAAASLIAGCGGSNFNGNGGHNGDAQTNVLNFALNLEYLEAQFYSYAVNGTGLSNADTGGSNATITGFQKITFSDSNLAAVANELYQDELAHVRFLRSQLGGSAIPCPALNLVAFGTPTSDATFLPLARAFEDVGVSAYGSASTVFSGGILQAVVQILGTEAYHAGNLRLFIAQKGIATTQVDPLDVLPLPSGPKYFTNDNNALAIVRDASQVLAVVYETTLGSPAHSGTTHGGFFPQGLNGVINTV